MTDTEPDVLIIFSREQLKKNKEIYEKLGEPLPKKYILINGKPKQYTDILKSEDNIIFTDTKILLTGKKSLMRFVNR